MRLRDAKNAINHWRGGGHRHFTCTRRRMVAMDVRLALMALLALTCLANAGAHAQDAKKHAPAGPVEVKADGTAGELTTKQIALVEKVSAYFNELSAAKGAFVQTSAGGARQRGKFYVQRPGRFRFDFARPSRLVIISDGRQVAIQDHDLKTDDRWNLDQTPFGALLQQDVNLLRDARFFEVQESDETIVIAFEDKSQLVSGPLKIFLVKQPALALQKWITKDLQGRDTLIELTDMVRVDDFEPEWFKPASIALEKLR
jgi:outer membrane lipoprotein-sorting protein